MDLLYLDIAEAFDLIDLSIIVTKMIKTSINAKAQQWITNFLSNKSQKVRVGCSIFSSRKVMSRVPPGLVLVLVLFLAFIADYQMTYNRTMSKLLKFLDDSKALTRMNSEESISKL